MANGIKLRRGLKTALAGTIADGEFVFCTDSGELGFKKGAVEKYIDLEKLSTDIGSLQTDVDTLQANTPNLLPGQFKHSVNLFYDYYAGDVRPINNGSYMIPIAKVNPDFAGNQGSFIQVIYFSNQLVTTIDLDGYGNLLAPNLLSHDYFIIKAVNDGYGGYSLRYDVGLSSSDLGCEILDDGYGNFIVYAVINIPNTTDRLRVAFDIDCISVKSKLKNGSSYTVFLPPTDLPIIAKPGAI